MAEITNDTGSKLKLSEDIKKDLIMKKKPQIRNSSPELVECRKNHPEIQSIKDFVGEKLQDIIKVVTGFEETLSLHTKKYEEIITSLENKLDYIQNLEKQNSCLQHSFNELNKRLNFVEQNCIHVRTERNYNQLGQQLNVDFTTPPRLYNTDFQVRDHKMSGGVWLYNRDNNSNVDSGLAASTEYFSTESPGKSTTLSGIQLAPGGERRKSTTEPAPNDSVDELQRRLDNLRGFNL